MNDTLNAVATSEQNSTTFRYIAEDFIAACTRNAMPFHREVLLFVLPAIVLFLVFGYLRSETPPSRFLGLIGAIISVGPVLAVYRFLLTPRLARGKFARQPLNEHGYRVALRSEGLAIDSDSGHALMPRKGFLRWRMKHRMTRIPMSPGLFKDLLSRIGELVFPIDGLRAALAHGVDPPAPGAGFDRH